MIKLPVKVHLLNLDVHGLHQQLQEQILQQVNVQLILVLPIQPLQALVGISLIGPRLYNKFVKLLMEHAQQLIQPH